MSNATPQLLITNVGLAAASVATPTGPYIHIVGFRISSAYGYTPTTSQTGLVGNDLYDGTATSYSFIGNNTIDVLLQIPPAAGPFDFGEVGLYLADSNGNFSANSPLFAIGVFDSPQTKFSSLGTNVVSSYNFNCLLQLAQSVAVFQINTTGAPPDVLDIYQWSDVYPPGVSANPDIPVYNVRELSSEGEGSILSNSTDGEWTLQGSYDRYRGSNGQHPTYSVANSSSTWVEFVASQFGSEVLSAANRRFVVRTADGFFRSVSSVQVSGSNYRFNLNCTNDGTYNNYPLPDIPAINSQCTVYGLGYLNGTLHYAQIIDPPAPPPAPPLATVGTPGLAYGGSGLYMPSAGVIEAHGLLHGPSSGAAITGAGRRLTTADDCNNTSLVSGLYVTATGSTGVPANWPLGTWDGILQVVNYGTITQTCYPEGVGGGDNQGNGGLTIYYRSFDNNLGVWSNWFPLVITGKQGGAISTTVTLQQLSTGSSSNFTASGPGLCTINFNSDGNPGALQTAYLNGTQVMTQTKSGGAGYGRRPLMVVSFKSGDQVSWSNTAGGTALVSIYYWSITS